MARAPATDMRRAAWGHARRVLCVRLDAMGDVLMTSPALRAARRSGPGRHITLLTSPAGADAARLVPDVDEVLVYESPWVKATPDRDGGDFDRLMIERLRRMRFDAAVVFTVYSQNPLPAAMLCYLADIPLRLAHCRENPYQLLTDWVPDPEPAERVRHEVRRQLDLVGQLGWRTSDERLRIAIPPRAAARAEDLVNALGLRPERPWAVVHPGASAPSRRYPPEHFAAAVRMLAERHGWRVVLTGSAAEKPLLEGVRAMAGTHGVSIADGLDLPELAALLARAPLLISNNTGPVHVAAAVGTPVVNLYALTNPQHTPWQVPSRVLYEDVPCKGCYKSACPQVHHDCLGRVPAERVVEAALELAAGAAGPADSPRSVAGGGDADLAFDLPRSAPAARSPRPVAAKPDIDVLIPTCNRPAALAVTLTSLAAQTRRGFRVIVSDQSDDADAPGREARAASRVLESRGSPVRMLRHLPRRGVAENRQYLLEQSDAPFVLCLDDDLIVEPYVLEMLVDMLERQRCGFVGCAVIGLSFSDDIRPHEQQVTLWDGPVLPEEVLPGTAAWERHRLHNAANLKHVQQRLGATPESPLPYRVAWVSGCVLYDAARLREVGGFSFWARLPPAHCGEDVLAQLRVMKAYGGCGVMPSGVYHQELPTTVPDRDVEAADALGWGRAAVGGAAAGEAAAGEAAAGEAAVGGAETGSAETGSTDLGRAEAHRADAASGGRAG